METFRLRETKEFLSLDELKEKCDISDNFMEILKVIFALESNVLCYLLTTTFTQPHQTFDIYFLFLLNRNVRRRQKQ